MRPTRLALALLAFVAAGCQGETPVREAVYGSKQSGAPTASRLRVIDEVRGSYRGVALGDHPREMHRTFGTNEPAGENEPVVPKSQGPDDPLSGPWHIPYGQLGPGRVDHYRYEHVTFAYHRDQLIWFETVEPGVSTRRGVAIGDPLERVEDAYPDARCGTAGGGDYEEYPACVVKLRPERYIWFGGDPISSIAVSLAPLEGV